MRSRFAIHSQVIVVSPLSLSAIRAFALSPLASFSNSPSFQPAWRSIPPMSRSAFCSSDSRISGPSRARVLDDQQRQGDDDVDQIRPACVERAGDAELADYQ